jgi:hypothetical protein
MDTDDISLDGHPIAAALASASRRAAGLTSERPRQPTDEEREQFAKLQRRQSVWESLVEAYGPRYSKCRLETFEATTEAPPESKRIVLKSSSASPRARTCFSLGRLAPARTICSSRCAERLLPRSSQ